MRGRSVASRLSRDFLLGVFPVTQVQYRRLMGDAAAPYFDGMDAAPMENVTWFDAIHFCNAPQPGGGVPALLSGRRRSSDPPGRAGLPPSDRGRMGVRLPGGRDGPIQLRRRPGPPASTRLVPGELAGLCPAGRTLAGQPVRPPRHARQRLGMVLGLVRPLRAVGSVDPAGPVRGTTRVLRGGSWYDPGARLCSSSRLWWEPNDTSMTAWKFGFRVAGYRTETASERVNESVDSPGCFAFL